MAAPNPYLKTKILTASPQQLRLMLLDGAVRFARQAEEGLRSRDFERSYEGLSRTQAILMELLNSLAPEHDPELCDRLSGLYTFMYNRLVTASQEKKPDIVAEVVKLLGYERETWRLLMDELTSEKSPEKGKNSLSMAG